jgi:hypothetical protein
MYTANLPWNLGLLDWLAASDSDSIKKSQSDNAVRPIGVTVLVEDQRARTNHIWAQMPMQTEYHLDDDGHTVDLWITPSADTKIVGGLLLGTFASSTKEGFLRCCAVAMSTMSTWSFQLQRPVAVREVRVEDKTNGAVWEVRPQAQIPLQMDDLIVSLETSNAIGSIQGRNVNHTTALPIPLLFQNPRRMEKASWSFCANGCTIESKGKEPRYLEVSPDRQYVCEQMPAGKLPGHSWKEIHIVR